MTYFKVIAMSALLALGAAPLAAAPDGLWLTGPDRHGNVAHVKASKCGTSLCGVIVDAYNKMGQKISSPNVGKRVFWDMRPEGDGTYKGRAYVPALGRDYTAKMVPSGNRMLVKGCAGPICMDQTWTRLK